MEFIAHRINTVEHLANTPGEFGVELDLRDRGNRLILVHDPFQDGEDFSSYLKSYRHGTMILNVKSERIEWRVLEELQQAGTVRDYFFLDCTYPMIRALVQSGEHNIAVRFSEYEPIANCLAMAGEVRWVWVDCFERLPLNDTNYETLREHFKICIVSPELQQHSLDSISEFARQIKKYPVDAVCTKRPDLWQIALDKLA
jgi:hypothetical protein